MDLQNLVGRKISVEQLRALLEYCKAELESQEGDEMKVKLDDTNQPYLWSVEGIARFFKGVLNIERGIPEIKIKKSGDRVVVDKSVEKVRPYIVAFSARGKKIDDFFIKQIIQLQEKLAEGIGRKRQKVAIGVYSYKKISFPVHYKAVDPESVKFVPLEFRREMSLSEILKSHPKGKENAWILNDLKSYPLLVDSSGEVLSFPPVINSARTGKIEVGDSELFFEATGTDIESLMLAANIFAYALYDRGFEISSVDVVYPNKKTITTPKLKEETIRIKKEDIKNLLGIEFRDSEVKGLLERARFDFSNYGVKIPSYRNDVLHPVDVIEDVAIMYGYNNIEPLPMKSYTSGGTFEIVGFINKIRKFMVGLGYQEVLSPILSNRVLLDRKMEAKDSGTVELSNFMSETYSCVRSWLLPILTDVLSKNKHVEYPQKIFEQGLATVRKGESVFDSEKLAAVSAHNSAGFTETRQALEALLRALGVGYSFKAFEHGSFIPGRAAKVIVSGREVAILGEIHPKVLENFGLDVPVAGFEVNLTELFAAIKK